jgi:hypothetical protein
LRREDCTLTHPPAPHGGSAAIAGQSVEIAAVPARFAGIGGPLAA